MNRKYQKAVVLSLFTPPVGREVKMAGEPLGTCPVTEGHCLPFPVWEMAGITTGKCTRVLHPMR